MAKDLFRPGEPADLIPEFKLPESAPRRRGATDVGLSKVGGGRGGEDIFALLDQFPVVAEPKAATPASKGWGQTLYEGVMGGVETAGLGMTGQTSRDPAAISRQLKDTQIPRSGEEQAFDQETAGAAKAFDDAEGFGAKFSAGLDILRVMARNPKQAAGTVAQSIGMSAPAFAAAGAGALAGSALGPVGTAVGAFTGYLLGNFATNIQAETAQKIEAELQSRGVNTDDPAAVERAIRSDPAFVDIVREYGIKKGSATSAVETVADVATAGVASKASKLIKAGETALSRAGRGTAAAGGAMAAQGVSEGLGSAAGSAAVGEDVSWGQALTEGAYGAVAGVPDAALAWRAGTARGEAPAPGVAPDAPEGAGGPAGGPLAPAGGPEARFVGRDPATGEVTYTPPLEGPPGRPQIGKDPAQPTDWQLVNDDPRQVGGVPPAPQLGYEQRALPGPDGQPPALGRPESVGPGFTVDAQGNVTPTTPDSRMADQSRAGDAARREGWLGGAVDRLTAEEERRMAGLGLTPDVREAQASRTEPWREEMQPGDVIFDGKRPFMFRSSAQRVAKKTGGEVVPVDGGKGFVVRSGKAIKAPKAPAGPKVPKRQQFARDNPFLAFLGKYGVKLDHKLDITGEAGREGNKFMPYYGWMFRRDGLPLDLLVEPARSAGFLTQADIDNPEDTGGTRKLAEMIMQAQRGEMVMDAATAERAMEAEMAMAQEGEGEFNWDDLADEVGVDEELEAEREAIIAEAQMLADEASDDQLDALVGSTLDAEGLTDEEAWNALGGDTDVPARAEPGGPAAGAQEPAGAVAEGPGEGRPDGGQEAGAPADFALTGQTPDEVKQQTAAKERDAAEKARRDAAPPADEFVLSGSDRPVDKARAQGQMELGEAPAVDAAAHEAATSPKNDLPAPTEGQIEAGNYAKGHVRISGMDIAIENPAGSRRRPEWPPLKDHYGYFKRTEGHDGDHVDVFIRPGTQADHDGPVFVVDQRHANGRFDEHKVVIGYPTLEAARAAYLSNYEKGWTGLKAITGVPLVDFKAWLESGDTKSEFAKRDESRPDEYVNRPAEDKDAKYAAITDPIERARVIATDAVQKTIGRGIFMPNTAESFRLTAERYGVSEAALRKAVLAELERTGKGGIADELRLMLDAAPSSDESVDLFGGSAPKKPEPRKSTTRRANDAVKAAAPDKRREEVDRIRKVIADGYRALGDTVAADMMAKPWAADKPLPTAADIAGWKRALEKAKSDASPAKAAPTTAKEPSREGQGQEAAEAEVLKAEERAKPAAPRSTAKKANAALKKPGSQPTPPVAKGFVRLYHGGHDTRGETDSLWFSIDLRYAKGYASKSSSGQVFYVDVPAGVRDDWFGGPPEPGVVHPTNANVPKKWADKRQPFVEAAEPPRRSPRTGARRNLLGNLFGSRRVANPSRAQDDALYDLREALGRQAATSGLDSAALDGLSIATVPYNARPIAASLKQLFGVDVVFVNGASALPGKLPFNGIYVGGRRVFIAADSARPFHQVIGHEFLHWLRRSSPDAYEDFTSRAAPFLKARATAERAGARSSEYEGYGISDDQQKALGWEEVYADVFGDAWADPAFWGEFLGSLKPKLAQTIANRWRMFWLRIRLALTGKAVDSESANPIVADLLKDAGEVRKVIASVMAQQAMQQAQDGAGVTAVRSPRSLSPNVTSIDQKPREATRVPSEAEVKSWSRQQLVDWLEANDPEFRDPQPDPEVKIEQTATGWMVVAGDYDRDYTTYEEARADAEDLRYPDDVPMSEEELREVVLAMLREHIHQADGGQVIAGRFGGPPIRRSPRGGATTMPQPPGPNAKKRRAGVLDTIGMMAGGQALADHVTKPLYDRLVRLPGRIGRRVLGQNATERIGAGLISDYGLSEPYVEAREVKQAEINKHLRNAKSMIDMLAGLNREQARIAYLWMTEKPDTATERQLMNDLPPEQRDVLQRMKKEVEKLGRAAVGYGLMSQETFDRNRMAYLHRTYLKHEAEAGASGRFSTAAAIRADNFKGRGLRHDVDADRILSDAVMGQPRVSKGDKFVRLERRSPVTEGEAEAARKNGKRPPVVGSMKLRAVRYWPAGRPVPAQYASWTNDGVWEARWLQKGQPIGMWRDFTPEERQRMGEIDEVRYSFAKTMLNGVRDVENHKFLSWVALNYGKDVAELEKQGITVHTAPSGYITLKTLAQADYVKVPDTAIAGTKLKKYGELSGMAVPWPVWNDLRSKFGSQPDNELVAMYDAMQKAWKISKTALSPAVHMNNVMANVVLADMADVTGRDIARAVEVLVKARRGDADAILIRNRYDDSNAESGSLITIELNEEIVGPILKQLKGEQDVDLSRIKASQLVDLLAHARFPEFAAAMKAKVSASVVAKGYRAMLDLYRFEDSVFRLAKFIRDTDAGMDDLAAGRGARDAFLNYDINAPWIQSLRRGPLPFIAFTYRAIPILARTAAEKPWKAAKYAAIGGALNAFGYAFLGLSGDDEDRERALLPDEKKGTMLGVFPRLIRMPWNDDNDQAVFLDVRRWLPAGDVFDLSQSQAAAPLPGWLTPGGPLAVMMELVLNKSGFTGKPLVLETDTPAETAVKVSDHVFKAFAPNLPVPNPGAYVLPDSMNVPGAWQTYSWAGIENAGKGVTDPFGRERSLSQALAGSVGIKLGSYPQDVAMRNKSLEFKSGQSEIERQLGDINRQQPRGGLTQEQANAKREAQVQKLRDLNEKLRKSMEAAR